MTNDQQEKVKIELPIKHNNIYAALSHFQGELKPMAKNGKVQFETRGGQKVDYSYTPLGDIMAAIYPLLKKHGLSVRHEISKEGIEAILTHETHTKSYIYEPGKIIQGESDPGRITEIKGDVKMNIIENEIRSGIVKITYGSEMKDIGAAITYARRYTLTMVLGISSEEDKDAELLEQSAKNAIQTVFDRFKAGLEKAVKVADVEKSLIVLEKDLKNIEAGKAPALGLAKEQYQELIKLGRDKIEDLQTNQA